MQQVTDLETGKVQLIDPKKPVEAFYLENEFDYE